MRAWGLRPLATLALCGVGLALGVAGVAVAQDMAGLKRARALDAEAGRYPDRGQ